MSLLLAFKIGFMECMNTGTIPLYNTDNWISFCVNV